MATRDIEREQRRTGRRPSEFLSRHDILLAVIPVAFVLALTATVALDVSTRTAIVAASLVGSVALVDGLFVHPPRRGSA
ncbi:MAG: hypothetical protein ABEH35_06545 [Haloarculaceae archaeon]